MDTLVSLAYSLSSVVFLALVFNFFEIWRFAIKIKYLNLNRVNCLDLIVFRELAIKTPFIPSICMGLRCYRQTPNTQIIKINLVAPLFLRPGLNYSQLGEPTRNDLQPVAECKNR